MHEDPSYRQEYISLLREHSKEISNRSANFQDQRRALKVLQNQEINAAGSRFGLLKCIFLRMKHIREMRKLNDSMESTLTSLRSAHQEEIYQLKSNWQLRHSLNETS